MSESRKERRLRKLRSMFAVAIDGAEQGLADAKEHNARDGGAAIRVANERLSALKDALEIAEFVIREEQ